MRLGRLPVGALVRLWLALALTLQAGGANVGGANAGAEHGSPELAAMSALLGQPIVLCHHGNSQPAPDRPSPLDDCCRHGWCQLLHLASDLPPSATFVPPGAVVRPDHARAIPAPAPASRRTRATGPRGPPKLD